MANANAAGPIPTTATTAMAIARSAELAVARCAKAAIAARPNNASNEVSSRPTEDVSPKSNFTPAPTKANASAKRATIQSPREALAPGVRSEIRASTKTGTVIKSPNERASKPKPKNGSIQLASSALGAPTPGLSNIDSVWDEAIRSKASGTNHTTVRPVVKSNGISFLGLIIARLTIKTSSAKPNTGELAATNASKIPDRPTCDQVETNDPGLEIPREATLAIERTRYGRSVIATT
ncbi:unannotated protein [freshwater metagenome]|uniref:Unannotated protein n=1 Tax=freshwater metagenome TaxID=449393 RepID=A0A6J6JRE3_9ZZZZ